MSERTNMPAAADMPYAMFSRYQPRLRSQLEMMVRTSRENIEDACSFAWLQLLRHPPEHETAYAWLLTVAKHEAIKLDRRSRRLLPLCGDDGALPELADPRDEIQIRDEMLDAAATVADARLTNRERRILALHVAGYSYLQIAACTGDSVRTVERQLFRARRKLHDALAAGG